MVKPSEGKLLYHITHLNNMPSIFKHGLLSRCQLRQNSNLNFVDIADQEILAKRKTMEIHSLNMCYFIFILKILLTLLYAMKTIQKIWCLLPFAEVYVSRVILSLLFPLIL